MRSITSEAPAPTAAETFPRRRRAEVGLLAVVGLYLALALVTSWLTPAWEANDESAHVEYVQTVAAGGLPEIGDHIESGQPPLYYAAVALWMHAAGIEPFSTGTRQAVHEPGEVGLQVQHDYTPAERRAAVAVHWLRMPSVLFGLVTVLCTYAIALRCGLTRRPALAATATVALWPKFLLVSATVQNDALGIAVGSVLILLVLRWLHRLPAEPGRAWHRSALPAGIGIAMGAAALTKYTVLPLAGLLGLVLLVAGLRSPRRRRLPEVALAGVVAGALCAWWSIRNTDRYGDPMASAATAEYLAGAMPGLSAPTSFTDGLRFGEFVPRVLLESLWYTGGWNQFVLPFVVNLGLTTAAGAALVGALRVGLRGGLVGGPRLSGWAAPVLWTSLAGAFVGLLLIARETTQAQGRYLFVAIAAIAVLLTVGTAELTDVRPRLQRWAVWLWPALLALAGLYANLRFLLPFAGL